MLVIIFYRRCIIVNSNEKCDPTGLIVPTIGEGWMPYAIIHCWAT